MGTSTFRRSRFFASRWRTILWSRLPELFRVFNMQRLILADGPFCCLVKERLASSVRMGWVSGRNVDGDSTAFLGCGTDGYGLFAPSGMRGTECAAGLRAFSGTPAAGS